MDPAVQLRGFVADGWGHFRLHHIDLDCESLVQQTCLLQQGGFLLTVELVAGLQRGYPYLLAGPVEWCRRGVHLQQAEAE